MLKATFKPGSTFRNIVEVLKDLNSEAVILCASTGITANFMDSSQIGLVDLNLPSELFASYECTEDFTIGISIKSLAKVMKTMNKDNVVQLVGGKKSDVLTIILYEDETLKDYIHEFQFKLMDIQCENLNIPKLDFEVCIRMASLDLKEILSTNKEIGDVVDISVTENSIEFITTGDMGVSKIKRKISDTCKIEIDKDMEKIIQRYGVKLLIIFLKASLLSQTMLIRMGEEKPLMFEFLVEKAGRIKYYLAPKLPEGDETVESIKRRNPENEDVKRIKTE
jgi:proliferating cell nuclear antigen